MTKAQGKPQQEMPSHSPIVLFGPIYRKMRKKLPNIAGGKAFLEMSAYDQVRYFEGIVLAAFSTEAAPRLAECYKEHPDLTAWLLPRVREYAVKLDTPEGPRAEKSFAMLNWGPEKMITNHHQKNGRAAAANEYQLWLREYYLEQDRRFPFED